MNKLTSQQVLCLGEYLRSPLYLADFARKFTPLNMDRVQPFMSENAYFALDLKAFVLALNTQFSIDIKAVFGGTFMDHKTVAAALEEVQNAYRIVFDFSDVLERMLLGFFKEFEGFKYYRQGGFSVHEGDNLLGHLAPNSTLGNSFDVYYTRSNSSRPHLCLEKGDALVRCSVMVNMTLYSDAADAKCPPFIWVAVLAATEDVPAEALVNEDSNNWYPEIWQGRSHPDDGIAMKHPKKPWIKHYTEIIELESMYDAASIKTTAKEFKERAEKQLGVTL